MTLVIVWCTLVLFSSLSQAFPSLEQRIIGGEDANIADFVYQLSLRVRWSHICGASIISDTWAVTAAHCLDRYPAITAVTFRAGSSDRLAGGQLFTVADYVIHPGWDDPTDDNDVAVVRINGLFDVAVVRINGMFDGTNIGKVRLAPRDFTVPDGAWSTVTGWGYTAPGGPIPQTLQRVVIPITNQEACGKVWDITENIICAGELRRDSCNGDSGGPLTSYGYQVGIVSFGSSNCGDGLPGVYTRVAAPSIRDFINSVTGV